MTQLIQQLVFLSIVFGLSENLLGAKDFSVAKNDLTENRVLALEKKVQEDSDALHAVHAVIVDLSKFDAEIARLNSSFYKNQNMQAIKEISEKKSRLLANYSSGSRQDLLPIEQN